jgi:primary-amine oxidase
MRRIALIVAAVGLLTLCQDARAQDKPSDCPQSVVVNFPTTGTPLTQWDLCFEVASRHGLIVRRASFRPTSLASPVNVLSDARVAEIFVPYHSGDPRLYEVSGANYSLRALGVQDCPASAGGTLLAGNRVCREIRDRGVAWHHRAKVRRGQEVALWGVLQAGTYQYIIEWTFQDDGTAKGQVGRTGQTLPLSPTEGHMHNFTWRLDIDLNGADVDTAQVVTHHESVQSPTDPGTTAFDLRTLVSTETSLAWTATEFTHIEVSDATLQNANGRKTAYALIPLRSGTARHQEAVTQADFWITRYQPTEVLSVDLPSYVNGENVDGHDVVLWYTGSIHRQEGSRDEDADTTRAEWAGFVLEARNMFAGTPLYP